jgi:hypothetical protein
MNIHVYISDKADETNIWTEGGMGVIATSLYTRKLDYFLSNEKMLKQSQTEMGKGVIYIGLGHKDNPDGIDPIDFSGNEKTDAYVGQTAEIPKRFRRHRKEKPWD